MSKKMMLAEFESLLSIAIAGNDRAHEMIAELPEAEFDDLLAQRQKAANAPPPPPEVLQRGFARIVQALLTDTSASGPNPGPA